MKNPKNKTENMESLHQIIINSQTKFLNDYKRDIATYSIFTSHNTVEYIMRSLNINIFIVTDSNRMPVKFCNCKLYKPENYSIIIFNLQGISIPPKSAPHYETLSDFYYQDNNDKDIYHITMYKWDEPLIQILFKQLCSIE